jgi:signal transduction histidine kinase
MSNAIKFSRINGKISIGLTCRATSSFDGRILITVSITDEGCGMDDEDAKKIFSEFIYVNPWLYLMN